MSTVRADRLRNDDRILRAAAEVLGSDPAASMQAVADAAGVSRLSVYRRYPDRDALVAALRAAIDVELELALDALPRWSDGGSVLEQLVHRLAQVAGRYPVALLRYAPVPDATPPVDERIVAMLRAGQQAGVLRDDVTAATLNAALFGVLSAVFAAGRPPGRTAADQADHAARTVTTLLLPGILTSSSEGST